MSDNWIAALHDHNAGINTFLACTTLSDLQGDGDYKLVLADLGTIRYQLRLKVYRGIQLVGESILNELPSAIVSFNNEEGQSCLPAVAVASGSALLIYKNLKPFYKFNLPPIDVNKIEIEAWKKAKAGELNPKELYEVLTKLKDQAGVETTALSDKYVSFSDDKLEDAFKRYTSMEITQDDVATCMTTMKKSSLDANTIDYVVIGTESGKIYCIDSQAFTILAKFTIPGAPAFVYAAGMYDVDYRIFVCNRDSEIYILKRGVETVSKPSIAMKADVIGMCRVSKQLVVAANDQTVSFYSMKGKCLKQLKFESRVVGVEMFQYEPRQYLGVFVALEKEIRLYQDYLLVDYLKYQYIIKWFRFGQFGREEAALIVGTKDGGLIVHLFRRTARLEEKLDGKISISAQGRKLNVPKKTKTYIDQALRERENARTMHQVFQRDLFMLKLTTARAFAEMSELSMNTVSLEADKTVEISVEINGFGPVFRLATIIRTISKDVLGDLWLLFDYDPDFYDFEKAALPLPNLISEKKYIFDNTVTCQSPEKKISKEVRVYLTDCSRIIVSAVVSMPITRKNQFKYLIHLINSKYNSRPNRQQTSQLTVHP
uniref:BBS1 domain-containing protein n=1 Tax=Syphacia muris TaxID=451379 RepID=A0A0N5AN52_9BILA